MGCIVPVVTPSQFLGGGKPEMNRRYAEPKHNGQRVASLLPVHLSHKSGLGGCAAARTCRSSFFTWSGFEPSRTRRDVSLGHEFNPQTNKLNFIPSGTPRPPPLPLNKVECHRNGIRQTRFTGSAGEHTMLGYMFPCGSGEAGLANPISTCGSGEAGLANPISMTSNFV